MRIFPIFNKVLIIHLMTFLNAKAALYDFVYENTDIFDKCSHIPGNNGVYDGLDLSNLTVKYTDGSLYIDGNITVVWDIEPTDRVTFRAEVFKFVRGAWQPTLITLINKDFCKEMFKTDTLWYKLWTSFIYEEDRKCINNKGHIFHHKPFNVDAKFNLINGVEGRVKCVIHFEAYDENDVKRPSSLCFESPGEIVKLKG